MSKVKSTKTDEPVARKVALASYRVTIRNAFVTTDVPVEAESPEAAVELVKAHLTANVNATAQ